MIAYSIQTALESKLFDRIVVSTDDLEIEKVARSLGADVPFLRSSATANDHAPVADALIEVIEKLAVMGHHYDEVCCLFATAPFITTTHIKDAYQLMADADAAFTVQKFESAIYRALRKNESGHLEMIWPEHRNTRSQDLPDAFHDAGQFYWIKAKTLLEERTLFAKKSRGYVLSSWASVDIDTEEDWIRAEVFYKLHASGDL
jgi:pseudaminic acid cytidylyltransferase